MRYRLHFLVRSTLETRYVNVVNDYSFEKCWDVILVNCDGGNVQEIGEREWFSDELDDMFPCGIFSDDSPEQKKLLDALYNLKKVTENNPSKQIVGTIEDDDRVGMVDENRVIEPNQNF